MKFVKCNSHTNILKPILEKWCSINQKFLKEVGSDCPWLYNERASVSILAVAAWKSGHVALEEYSTKKGRKKNDTERPGRCDLKIRIDSKDFLFEAKQQRVLLGKKSKKVESKGICDRVFNSLDMARHDSGKLKSLASRRFGVSFIIPRVAEGEADRLHGRVSELLHLLEESKRRYDAIAWYFPRKKDLPRKKAHIYPGVLLIVKEVRRSL
jgi:hypothetical protein